MSRINLRLYQSPYQAETIIAFDTRFGTIERMAALVDTGAAKSLLPITILDLVPHTKPRTVTLEQAGISSHQFYAIEAMLTLWLEDTNGNLTKPMEAVVWFTHTSDALLGFEDVMAHAILHIDMPQQQGYLEFNE